MEVILYITIFACSIKNNLCYRNFIMNTGAISQLSYVSKIPRYLEHSTGQNLIENKTEILHQNRRCFKNKDVEKGHKIVKRQNNNYTEAATENTKQQLDRGRNNIFISLEDNTPLVIINFKSAKNESNNFNNQPYSRKGLKYNTASSEETIFTDIHESNYESTRLNVHRNYSPNKRRIPRKITTNSREYRNTKTTVKLKYDIEIKDKIRPWKRFKGSLQLRSESYENKNNKKPHSEKGQNDIIEEKHHKHKSKGGKKGMDNIRKKLLGMLMKKMKSEKESNSIMETNSGVTMLLRNSPSDDEKELKTVEPGTLAEKSLRRFKLISKKHALNHGDKMEEIDESIPGVTILSQNSYQDKNKRPKTTDHIERPLRRYKIISNKHSFEYKANDRSDDLQDYFETGRPLKQFFSGQSTLVYRNDKEASATENSGNKLHEPETEENINKKINKINNNNKESSVEPQLEPLDKPANEPHQEKINLKSAKKEKQTPISTNAEPNPKLDSDKTKQEVNLTMMFNKFADNSLLDNLTNIIMNKMLEKRNPKHKSVGSVERIEIVLGSDDKVQFATEKPALAERILNEPKKKPLGTKRRIYYLK